MSCLSWDVTGSIYHKKSNQTCVKNLKNRVIRSRDICIFTRAYYVNFRFFAIRAHSAQLFFIFEFRFEFLVILRVFTVLFRVVFLNFFGYGRVTQKRVFSPRRVSARFFVFFRVFRQSASQTLIVWGGCRFRPHSHYRNLCHIESMSLYNRAKALTVLE